MSTQSSFYIFDFLSDLINTSSEWMDLGGKNIQLILLYVLKCRDKLMQEKTRAECKYRHSCHNPIQGNAIRRTYVRLDKQLHRPSGLYFLEIFQWAIKLHILPYSSLLSSGPINPIHTPIVNPSLHWGRYIYPVAQRHSHTSVRSLLF